ncbi:MAG: diguanylate cyclase [Flavobacteriales bacterium]|nr:diguanylate cyclase [Flavobacteriales bacterium]
MSQEKDSPAVDWSQFQVVEPAPAVDWSKFEVIDDNPDRWQNTIARGVGTMGESVVQAGGVVADALVGFSGFIDKGLSGITGRAPRAEVPAPSLAANEFARDMRASKDELFPAPRAQKELEGDLSRADGFLGSLLAYGKNPLGSAQMGVEMLGASIPAVRALGIGMGSGVLAGGGAGVDAGATFDDEARRGIIQDTPAFQKLAGQYGEDKALELMKTDRIRAVTGAGAAVGALTASGTSALGLNPVDDAIAGMAGTAEKVTLKSAAKKIASEAGGEVVEEVPTQIATNVASGSTGGEAKWSDDVGSAAAGGLVLGGLSAVPFVGADAVRQKFKPIDVLGAGGDTHGELFKDPGTQGDELDRGAPDDGGLDPDARPEGITFDQFKSGMEGYLAALAEKPDPTPAELDELRTIQQFMGDPEALAKMLGVTLVSNEPAANIAPSGLPVIGEAPQSADMVNAPESFGIEQALAAASAPQLGVPTNEGQDAAVSAQSATTAQNDEKEGQTGLLNQPAPRMTAVDRDARIKGLLKSQKAGAIDGASEKELTNLLIEDRSQARVAGSRQPIEGMTVYDDERVSARKIFIDGDGFNAINKKMGHSAGDEIIKFMGEAIAAEFPGDADHKGGDEFYIHSNFSDEEAAAKLEKVRAVTRSKKFVAIDADGNERVQDGVDFSFGIGSDVDGAEKQQYADKAARAAAGLRVERSETDRRNTQADIGRVGEADGERRVQAGEVRSPVVEQPQQPADLDLFKTATRSRGTASIPIPEGSDADAVREALKRAGVVGVIAVKDGALKVPRNQVAVLDQWIASQEKPSGAEPTAEPTTAVESVAAEAGPSGGAAQPYNGGSISGEGSLSTAGAVEPTAAAAGQVVAKGKYKDGTDWEASYSTRKRTDGSFVLIRTMRDADGERVQHLHTDGSWVSGEPPVTAVFGGKQHSGPENFPSEEYALAAARTGHSAEEFGQPAPVAEQVSVAAPEQTAPPVEQKTETKREAAVRLLEESKQKGPEAVIRAKADAETSPGLKKSFTLLANAMEGKDAKEISRWVENTDNKILRAAFTEATGIKLPKTIGGTRDAVAGWVTSSTYKMGDVKAEIAAETKTPKPVTPQVASKNELQSFIGIAADSIEKLRAVDVERVIREAPTEYRQALAEHIKTSRQDLAGEVDDVMAEGKSKSAPVAIAQGADAFKDGVKPEATEATHQEPGAKPEPVTAPVVAEAIKKSATNSPLDLKEAKSWLLKRVDEAMKVAPAKHADINVLTRKVGNRKLSDVSAKFADPDSGKARPSLTIEEGNDGHTIKYRNKVLGIVNSLSLAVSSAERFIMGAKLIGETWDFRHPSQAEFVTFDVPGDGKFKVLNTRENLQAFRSSVEKSGGFKNERKSASTPMAPRSEPWTAINDFLIDDEYGNIYTYSNAVGSPLRFGEGAGVLVNAYAVAENVVIAEGLDTFVGRAVRGQDRGKWFVIEAKTGLSVSPGHSSKEAAITDAKAAVRPQLAALQKKVSESKARTEKQREQDWLKASAPDVYEMMSESQDTAPAPQTPTQPKAPKVEEAKAPPKAPKVEAPAPAPPKKPEVSANTIFTADAAEAARARLKAKFNRVSSGGLDPEMMLDGITLSGYHIESGARKFAAYARAMIQDLGAAAAPYLKSWYLGVKFDPRSAGFDGMDSAASVEGANIDDALAEGDENATPNQPEPPESGVRGGDPKGAPSAQGGRERAAQSGDAPPDTGNVADAQPDNVEEPAAVQSGESAGVRASGTDVEGGQESQGGGNARPGRKGAGRKKSPDAGAGKTDTTDTDVERTGEGATDRKDDDSKGAEPKDVESVSPANPGPGNFHIANPLEVVGGGQVARFNKNKAAIELFIALRDEGRRPTREEQEVLAGYTGWGSFGQELFNGNWSYPRPKQGWEQRDKWLRDHLGRADWEGLQRSITNAHYTDPPTIMAMWEMVRRMGFKGGRVLEPGMGIGNFYGMMPIDLKDRSKLAGIELDPVTGGMAQMLYPDAVIKVMGYQDSKTPDDFYDLVIGNWPFENTGIADRRYNHINPMLHDYFFLKALDQVRPGGIVIGITSAGSMDKKGMAVRRELAKKAELVASFRLPSGAFEDYAGTKVVTDIVILRKRAEPVSNVDGEVWIDTVDMDTKSGEKVRVNAYYQQNPQNVIGTIDYGHGATTFGPGMIVHRPDNMQEQLDRIVAMVQEGAYLSTTRKDTISYIANHTSDREGALTRTDDGLFIVRGEHLAPAHEVHKYQVKSQKETAAREAQLNALIDMRKAYGRLIEAERGTSGVDPEPIRKQLREQYEAFSKAYGPMSESFGLGYLEKIDDPFYYALAALETKDGEKYRPADILSKSTIRSARRITNPSIRDAFVLARNGSVNPSLEEIAKHAGQPEDKVRAELVESGAVFETPGGDIVPSDMYLSGNVREKLRQAKIALDDGNDAMRRNVAALEKVQPADIPYFNIEAQMGATWVSTGIYEKFVAHMLNREGTEGIEVRYTYGRWNIDVDRELQRTTAAITGFGTRYYRFGKLVNAAISNQTVVIKYKDPDGREFVDKTATDETNAKIADMREKFGEWLWKDPERRIAIEREYNEVRNSYASPSFDGSFLTFEGMALSVGRGPFDLRQHQINAIWRALVMRRSLNAHEVGTGKTFTMGGIAIESRRYGIAKKPVLLAHNANSKSVASEIQMMYPAAKILYLDNLSPKTIDVRMRQIANDDWDLIVLPHSLIERLSFREETLMGMAREEIEGLEAEARQAASEDGQNFTEEMLNDPEELRRLRSPTAKELVKQRARIIETIRKQAQESSREGAVPFEELGIDMVLVDEAHEFKKPPMVTRMKMKGLQTQTSQASIQLNFLTRYVREQNNGGNVHLFTGTPITNTLTEIFHQMRYIMADEMAAVGVDQWDGWFGSFAKEEQDVELTAAGDYEAVNRLRAFINAPELRKMIGQYMDVVFSDDMPEMQPRRTKSGKLLSDQSLTELESAELLNGRLEGAKDRPYKKVVNETADPTPDQSRIFEEVQALANEWRNMGGKARKEAMSAGMPVVPIVYEQAAARASFDARMENDEELAGKEGSVPDHKDSKISRAIRNLLDIYNSDARATQVVFTNTGLGTSANRAVRNAAGGAVKDADGKTIRRQVKVFSPIKDMVERLVQQGIPRSEIEIVDGSTSKDRRKEVADAMNAGTIRIVIGSTQSLGVGVNMQRNLRAMHHLDAPWMPGDLEQRNGRGHRQGNQWNTVLEYRYITDRIDGRRWQVLSIKQRFITKFLKADGDVRVIEGDAASDEESDIVKTFAEAAGDPRILIRQKLIAKVEQLQKRERIHTAGVADAISTARDKREALERLKADIKRIEKSGGADEKAAAIIADHAGDKFKITVDGVEFTSRKEANDAFDTFIAANMRNDAAPMPIGSYGGAQILVAWPRWYERPAFVITIEGEPIATGAASVGSLEGSLRSYKDKVDKMRATVVTDIQAIQRLDEVAGQKFQRADQLKSAARQLSNLEKDIQANPVPPPAWLRNGAAVDTDVIWNGTKFEVTGHRWNASGWFVIAQDAKGGEVIIPYLDVKDAQGMRLYEEREFKAPVVHAKPPGAAPTGAAPAAAPVQETVVQTNDAPEAIEDDSADISRWEGEGGRSPVMLSRSDKSKPTGSMSRGAVQAIVDEFLDSYSGNIDLKVVVVNNIDEAIGTNWGPARAAYHAGSGTVVLAHDHLANKAEVLEAIRHEILGHYGLDTLEPSAKTRILQSIVDSKVELKDAWTKIDRMYGDKPEMEKAEEVFAHVAQGDTFGRAWDSVLSFVARGLRSIGLVRGIVTMPELRKIAREIAEGIKNGARSQVQRKEAFPVDLSAQMRARLPGLLKKLKAAPPKPATPFVTSTKNAVADDERIARGLDPIEKEPVQTNEETLAAARAKMKRMPHLAGEVVERAKLGGVNEISLSDEALLLVAKADLMNKRNAAGDRASDITQDDAARAAAKRDFEEAEAKIHDIDLATHATGAEWGRLGQFRQRMLREDYSLAALERKQRVIEGRPLVAEEIAAIKVAAEEFERLQNKVDETEAVLVGASEKLNTEAAYANLVREAAKETGLAGRVKKRPMLEKLRLAAEQSRKALSAPSKINVGNKKQGGAIDAGALYHYATIGAFHVAEMGVRLADWVASHTADWTTRMRKDLGELFGAAEESMGEILANAHMIIASSGIESVSMESIMDNINPEDITHDDVYQLARAAVLSGVHGEDAVMQAVTEKLKEISDISERDVRRLFSEYGEAKFPSPDADKAELRELRALVQMQESIDRLEEGLSALRSGLQRDKQSQLVREKRAKLNQMLKLVEDKSAPSPEKLATYQDARRNNLLHQIEDIEKQLRTGERPDKRVSPELTDELKGLIKQRDALRKKLREEDAKTGAGQREYLEQRARMLEKQIKVLEGRIAGDPKPDKPGPKPTDARTEELKRQRDALNKQLKAIEKAKNPGKSPEERYQDARGKGIARELAKVQARIAAGDYARHARPVPKELNEANTKAAYALQKAKYDYAVKQFEAEMAKRSPLGKILGGSVETLNVARAYMTSLDLSAVLRQGGFIAYGNPLRAMRSFVPMLRAFASDEAAFAVNESLQGRGPNPRANARAYKMAGLELTESHNSYKLTKVEENFQARWLDSIPKWALGGLVRGSSRSFVTFLNLLRADSFDAMTAALALREIPSAEEAKAIANYINVATGRGKIGTGAGYQGTGLNTVFFAPRLVASRFNLLAGQPLYGGSNRTRKLIAQEYARFMAGVGMVFVLAAIAKAMLGDDDDEEITSFDPRSSNFLKIKVGDYTYVDPLAGLAQVTVFVARELSGETVSTKGKLAPLRSRDGVPRLTDVRADLNELAPDVFGYPGYLPSKPGYGQRDGFNVLVDFGRTKLAPFPSAIINTLAGENVVGQTTTDVLGVEVNPVVGEAVNMVVPMSLSNIDDLLREHGVAGGMSIQLLNMLGMGVQYRDPSK